MVPAMILPLLGSALLVGMLIGAVGIGGILLIPAFMIFSNLTIHQAAATALFTYLFTGLLGAWLFARKGTIAWRTSVPACVGALLFGVAGALIGGRIPPGVLVWIVASILCTAGAYILLLSRQAAAGTARDGIGSMPLFGIGAVSGFGAGISGAGGPLFSVPIMLAMQVDPLVAVGSGQVVQIAASVSGSLGNLGHETIQYGLAAPVTAAELLGVMAGVRIAHSVPAWHLRAGAAVLCIVSALAMLARHFSA